MGDAELDFRKINLTQRTAIHETERPAGRDECQWALDWLFSMTGSYPLTHTEPLTLVVNPLILHALSDYIARTNDALAACQAVGDVQHLKERVGDIENILKDGEVFDPYDDQLAMLKRINERDGGLIEHMERRLSAVERKVFG